jgi:hypothetical protein
MLPPQWRPIKVTREGEPIEQYSLQETVDTGISLGNLLPGMVPLYEEREACCTNNYTWRQWEKLNWKERAELLLEMNRSDAMNREMKRRNRSKD